MTPVGLSFQSGECSPVVHLDVTSDLQQLVVAYWDETHQLNVAAVSGRGRVGGEGVEGVCCQCITCGSFQPPISVQVSILVISDRLAELQHLAVVFSRLSSHLQVPASGVGVGMCLPLPSPSLPSPPLPLPLTHATSPAVHEQCHSSHVRGLGGGPPHDGEQASRLCSCQCKARSRVSVVSLRPLHALCRSSRLK